MAKYIIYGKYKGKKEKVDEAKDKQEAAYLVHEYQLAFGREWNVWAEKK